MALRLCSICKKATCKEEHCRCLCDCSNKPKSGKPRCSSCYNMCNYDQPVFGCDCDLLCSSYPKAPEGMSISDAAVERAVHFIEKNATPSTASPKAFAERCRCHVEHFFSIVSRWGDIEALEDLDVGASSPLRKSTWNYLRKYFAWLNDCAVKGIAMPSSSSTNPNLGPPPVPTGLICGPPTTPHRASSSYPMSMSSPMGTSNGIGTPAAHAQGQRRMPMAVSTSLTPAMTKALSLGSANYQTSQSTGDDYGSGGGGASDVMMQSPEKRQCLTMAVGEDYSGTQPMVMENQEEVIRGPGCGHAINHHRTPWVRASTSENSGSVSSRSCYEESGSASMGTGIAGHHLVHARPSCDDGHNFKDHDWYLAAPGPNLFVISDMVDKFSKDSDGHWWPLTILVHDDLQITIGTVQAGFIGGKGTGALKLHGTDLKGYSATAEALVALSLLRARARELRTVLGLGGRVLLKDITDLDRDVSVFMIPTFFLCNGASSSLAVFLALVKLYFKPYGIRLRSKMAVTGVLSLSGLVLRVGNVVAKIKGALKYGAELVIVPSMNRSEIDTLLKEVEETPERAQQTAEEANKAEEEANASELEAQEAEHEGGERAEAAQKNAEEARKRAREAREKARAAEAWRSKAAQPDPDRLTREEVVNHVRYVTTAVDVLEHAIEDIKLAKKKPEDLAKVKRDYLHKLQSNINNSNLGSIGCCPALLIQRSSVRPDGQPGDRIFFQGYFSEAAAIPSYPRKGKLIIPGIASQPCLTNTAVSIALDWVKTNMDRLKEYLGEPYIDIFRRLRMRQNGPYAGLPYGTKTGEEEVKAGGSYAVFERRDFPHVDVILHVPPHVNATYLQPSMIIAIIMMAWRMQVKLASCSVVGTLDDEGRVVGYPELDRYYLAQVMDWGFRKVIVSPTDAESLKASAREMGVDLVEKGVTVIGCETMMDMVKAVFPK